MIYQGTPVWSFPLNWGDGLTETLEWKTAVLASTTGIEQRIMQRQTPRRTFEGSFVLDGERRALFDNFMHRYGGSDFAIPLWHSQAQTTAVSTGSVVHVPTAFREFEAGDMVMLRSLVTQEIEIATIQAVAPDTLQLIANLAKPWGIGTLVYPMRPARFEDAANMSATSLNDRVWTTRARFGLTKPNPFEVGQPPIVYAGFGVLNQRPNESQDTTHTWARTFDTLDNDAGLRKFVDTGKRAFGGQSYRWTVWGDAANVELREYLYYLRGRQKSVWLPSFHEDLYLAQPITPGSAALYVKNTGYAEGLMHQIAGRQDIRIETIYGQTLFAHIIGSAPADGTTDRLTLAAPIVESIPLEHIRCISFMSLSRLDADRIEMTHFGDIAGATDVAVTWRAVGGKRTAEPWDVHPFGDTVMNSAGAYCYCTRGTCVGRHEILEMPFVVMSRVSGLPVAQATPETAGKVMAVVEKARDRNQGFDLYLKQGAPTPDEVPKEGQAAYCGYNPSKLPAINHPYDRERFPWTGGEPGGNKGPIRLFTAHQNYGGNQSMVYYRKNGTDSDRFGEELASNITFDCGAAQVKDQGRQCAMAAIFIVRTKDAVEPMLSSTNPAVQVVLVPGEGTGEIGIRPKPYDDEYILFASFTDKNQETEATLTLEDFSFTITIRNGENVVQAKLTGDQPTMVQVVTGKNPPADYYTWGGGGTFIGSKPSPAFLDYRDIVKALPVRDQYEWGIGGSCFLSAGPPAIYAQDLSTLITTVAKDDTLTKCMVALANLIMPHWPSDSSIEVTQNWRDGFNCEVEHTTTTAWPLLQETYFQGSKIADTQTSDVLQYIWSTLIQAANFKFDDDQALDITIDLPMFLTWWLDSMFLACMASFDWTEGQCGTPYGAAGFPKMFRMRLNVGGKWFDGERMFGAIDV